MQRSEIHSSKMQRSEMQRSEMRSSELCSSEMRSSFADREIIRYPSGLYCHHCVWLQDFYKLTPRLPRAGPLFWICKKYPGCTVYNKSGYFPFTFMVVYGVKNSSLKHSLYDLTTLLECSTLFIEHLHSSYNMSKIRLLVNSNFDRDKYGSKEHLHSLVTMNSAEDEKIFIEKISDSPGKVVVKDQPWENDRVINLTKEDCHKLIRSDAWAFVADKLKVSTQTLKTQSFYLFLNYEKGSQSTPSYTITGKISTF